ncbi:MAG: hypothetical protein KY441_11000, partial [Actinobacteria bacterium]|nr:hypothetical protein [Actinomycetota bacterium]
GLTSGLARLAGRAPVPVFPVVGAGGRRAATAVRTLDGIEVVTTPRAAVVLLVVGRVTRALLGPVLALHDQLPGPRAAVQWRVAGDDGDGGDGGDLAGVLPALVVTPPGDGERLHRLMGELVSGTRPSSPPALPPVEPAAWRGVGPYGQGGTGMTGGVPYGRPIPGWADDRDGLKLDQLKVRLGPAFPPFPPGLVLDVEVQGDVLQTVSVGDNPFVSWSGDPPVSVADSTEFTAARTEAVAVADLELARARHHLVWLAAALRHHGLAARGERVLRLASGLTVADRAAVEALARSVVRSRSLAWATDGVGVLSGDGLPAGPVARAAGSDADARTGDEAYRDLGFEPVTGAGGDARARLRQRVAEAVQALELAERAGDRRREPGGAVEGPRGTLPAGEGESTPSAALLDRLPDVLAGQEWGDAVTTVVSLDLDLEEAALGAGAAVAT